jgi:hypothetical protein
MAKAAIPGTKSANPIGMPKNSNKTNNNKISKLLTPCLSLHKPT